MPAPLPPDHFTPHGVDLATSSELSRQHNELAGFHTAEPAPATSPSAPTPAPRAPLNPAHEAQVAARAAEVQKLTGTDAATAGSVAQQEFSYRAGSGVERAVMLSELEAQRTDQAVQDSIAAGMTPPKAPYEYILPGSPESPRDQEIFQTLRGAMFDAGIPRELGNRLAESINDTAAELLNADVAKVGKIVARNEAALRRLWGPAFDSRLTMVYEFIRAQSSPAVRELFKEHPELFTDPTASDILARVAEHQRRIGRRT